MWRTDGRTDGRTDRILIARPRLHFMQRGKNCTAPVNLFVNSAQKLESPWFRPSDQENWPIWFDCAKVRKWRRQRMATTMRADRRVRLTTVLYRSVVKHYHMWTFEHKFWNYNFLMYFVRFIDNGFRKLDRHKHTQSANIAWNVLILCLRLIHGTAATKRTYAMKFLHQVFLTTLAFSCEIVHETS